VLCERSLLLAYASNYTRNYLPAQLIPVSGYDVGVETTEGLRQESEVDRITLVGLVFETASGLHRAVGRPLERQCELAGQDFEILIRLARTPGGRLRMSDLAAQTALTPSGLTRAVDRLSDAGLVTRQACPEDRRGAFAALTESGDARMRQALDIHRNQLSELLEGALEPEEELALVATLRKLRDRVNPEASFLTP
jgi:MarR family 2-MHQ and catechol resistance regulon transcriptional repressor